MFSKSKKTERIDSEQREQYEYARARIKQKKKLMRHFIVFIIGSIFLIIINPVLGYGNNFIIKDWFVWAILIWAFIFLIHLFNVLVMNKFMGKEWEARQLELLKAKQEKRIAEIDKQAAREVITEEVKKKEGKRRSPARDRMITIIAAAGENNELGKNNDLVWHLPNDFKRFKQLTTGHHIIMGRKTFESFPKPLPNRTHIIITRNKSYQPVFPKESESKVILVNSMKEALEKSGGDSQPFIIGGGEIYEIGMDYADKIELTRVHANFTADTFFPAIPSEEWKIISEVLHEKDERHKYAFSYQTFIRK